MAETLPSNAAEPLSEAELRSLIARHLPAWLRACDTDDGDSIVLHEASFGTSTHELFLFACAIKYALAKGKHVHVASGTGRTKREPEKVLPSAVLGSVYREDPPGKRHTPTRRRNPKKTKPRK
ncbi:MAG TPA: hypothetical protein VGQ21_18665 [Thermoanaerobaculia bacterium]|jgi:hypothetical protein|nr:hypothetical protein [Thermoanaerobaculia bacterium]